MKKVLPFPEGTKEEINLAYNVANDISVRILNYSSTEEIPKDILDFQRRLIYFLRDGPRKGYMAVDTTSKVTQSDVLYILTSWECNQDLAEKFNISKRLVELLKAGDRDTWKEEYNLVKKLSSRIRKSLERKYNNKSKTIAVLGNIGSKELLYFSNKLTAKFYRKKLLTNPKHASYIGDTRYEELDALGEIDKLYPINIKRLHKWSSNQHTSRSKNMYQYIIEKEERDNNR